jgi:ribosomal protein L16/L10AE
MKKYKIREEEINIKRHRNIIYKKGVVYKQYNKLKGINCYEIISEQNGIISEEEIKTIKNMIKILSKKLKLGKGRILYNINVIGRYNMIKKPLLCRMGSGRGFNVYKKVDNIVEGKSLVEIKFMTYRKKNNIRIKSCLSAISKKIGVKNKIVQLNI